MTVYSHSKLETFSNCPLRYKFLYLDKLAAETDTVEAFLGSCVHLALEWLYKQVQMARVPQLDDLIQVFHKVWRQNYSPNIKVVQPEFAVEDFYNVGEKCLRDYYQTYYPFNSGQILGLEQRILVNINGYQLQGYVDRLEKSPDGTYVVHDYKTSRTLPTQEKLDSDRQLALYQIGLKQLWPHVDKVKLVWHYLFFNEELTSVRSEEQLEVLKQEITDLIAQVEQATNSNQFPAKETVLCDWCEFQEHCPKRKHLFIIQNLDEEERQKERGFELVNAYAKLAAKKSELKEQLDEIETEMQKIKTAIADFAVANGCDTVAGSTLIARVKQAEKVIIPAKGKAERQELDKLIKQLGLWANVSDLNPYSLKELLLSGKIDAKEAELIKKFVQVQTEAKVSFAKNVLKSVYDK